MTPAELLAHLIARTHLDGGTPLGDIGPDSLDALMALQDAGKVILTDDPPMAWVHPDAMPPERERVSYRRTYVESDLPPDVDLLKHAPDRDSMPVSGMRLNGEPVYRPRDEPSSLILCGSQPWPPEGTEIQPRWYRPARAKWTTEERRDLVVTGDRCPVCGREESKRTSPVCLACDCWPSSYPTTVRTLEAEPDDQPKPKAKKKGAKAG